MNRSPILLAVLLAGTAHAATITVDTTNDLLELNEGSGDCSLREAVTAANQNAPVDGCTAGDDANGGDTITFADALADQTITLTGAANDDGNQGGDLDVSGGFFAQTPPSLTIQGPTAGDAGSIVIDGGGVDRVLDAPSLIETPALRSLRLVNLTVRNGLIQTVERSARGGGIRVEPSQTQLSLENVRITGNQLSGPLAQGGGVFTSGAFSITDSVISGNIANADAGAASGGGFFRDGFVPVDSRGPTVIMRSEISQNQVTSGNDNAFGGGVYFAPGDTDETLLLANSTVSGNSAVTDGVEAFAAGGGLYVGGTGSIFFNSATLADNAVTNNSLANAEYGGGFVVDGVSASLVNTLVATNAATNGPDCADTVGGTSTNSVNSLGFNLIGDGTDCTEGNADDQVGGLMEQPPINPQLGPLGDNGGPTRTHALLPNSPAIDTGNPEGAETGCLTTDQRGEPRPIDGDGSGTAECDIGAYEAAPNQPPTVVQAIGDQTLSLSGGDLTIDLAPVFEDPEGQPLTFTAESNNPGVATATVEGATLVVTAISAGTATIAVTATDTMQAFRQVEVPISDGGGELNAAAGGCTLAPEGRLAPDPSLWLLIAAALGWRYRRRWLTAPHHRRH